MESHSPNSSFSGKSDELTRCNSNCSNGSDREPVAPPPPTDESRDMEEDDMTVGRVVGVVLEAVGEREEHEAEEGDDVEQLTT